ncbi:Uncharacterised protein [Mycobacteroides abscessus subsp. abscessus]|nr:Uncharacterised protein [Mycobacteroides abscessus subsp. abscessus]
MFGLREALDRIVAIGAYGFALRITDQLVQIGFSLAIGVQRRARTRQLGGGAVFDVSSRRLVGVAHMIARIGRRGCGVLARAADGARLAVDELGREFGRHPGKATFAKVEQSGPCVIVRRVCVGDSALGTTEDNLEVVALIDGPENRRLLCLLIAQRLDPGTLLMSIVQGSDSCGPLLRQRRERVVEFDGAGGGSRDLGLSCADRSDQRGTFECPAHQRFEPTRLRRPGVDRAGQLGVVALARPRRLHLFGHRMLGHGRFRCRTECIGSTGVGDRLLVIGEHGDHGRRATRSGECLLCDIEFGLGGVELFDA